LVGPSPDGNAIQTPCEAFSHFSASTPGGRSGGIEVLSKVDQASKSYDGPIPIVEPTLESRIVDIAVRRKRMEESYNANASKVLPTPDFEKIERFLGYGNPNAEIVFVGLEEGLADVKRLDADLRYRSTFSKSVMDVFEAHLGLAKGRKLFRDKPRGQRTWRVMADVLLHWEDRVPPRKEDRSALRKRYRANVLGDDGDLALLLELLPLPHVNSKHWLYKRYDRYDNRDDYEAEVIDKRLELLRDAIAQCDRKAIICYGHKGWNDFKRLFPKDTEWVEDRGCFGKYLSAECNGAKVTLTNHFVSKYFNRDEQLDELAAVVLPPPA